MINVVASTTSIPPALMTLLRERCGSLQMLPGTAAEALDITDNPNCSISQFASVIERDVKLAADILSIANSVSFSNGNPIGSLHQAIVRLGLRQCRNLIISSSLSALLKRVPIREESIRTLLWRHSFLTAMVALHLNRALHVGFQGEEFTAGLLHDLGRTLLAICLPDKFKQLDPLDFNEDESLIEREIAICGTTHCEAGAWFAREHRLPETLIEAVACHHDPTQAVRAPRLVAVTAAADHMANYLQRTGHVAGYEPESNRAIGMLEQTGLTFANDTFLHASTSIMEQAQQDFELQLGTSHS